MFSSSTRPHFLHDTSPIVFAIFAEPHSGHLNFILNLKTVNLLSFILLINIFLKKYTRK